MFYKKKNISLAGLVGLIGLISLISLIGLINVANGQNMQTICNNQCVSVTGDADRDECIKNCMKNYVLPGSGIDRGTGSGNVNSIDISCKEYGYPWCGGEAKDPAGLVGSFYKIALGLAGAAALGVLIYGAILWTLSGAVTSKQDAKEWISGALWGLVLLLGAYLILYTINPRLVKIGETQKELEERMKPVKIQVSEKQKPGTTVIGINKVLAPSELTGKYYYGNNPDLLKKKSDKSNWTDEEKKKLYTHEEAVQKLKEAGIEVKSSTGVICADHSSSKCVTSLTGIPKDSIDILVASVKDFRQTGALNKAAIISVTGGTESAVKHKEQGFGYPSLDITYNKSYYNFMIENKNKYGAALVNENTGTKDSINVGHATAAHTSFYTNEAAAKRGVNVIKNQAPYTGDSKTDSW
jgi:hypothetical protein